MKAINLTLEIEKKKISYTATRWYVAHTEKQEENDQMANGYSTTYNEVEEFTHNAISKRKVEMREFSTYCEALQAFVKMFCKEGLKCLTNSESRKGTLAIYAESGFEKIIDEAEASASLTGDFDYIFTKQISGLLYDLTRVKLNSDTCNLILHEIFC